MHAAAKPPPVPRFSTPQTTPPVGKTALARAFYAFKYAGAPRLSPRMARLASYVPVVLLMYKGIHTALDEMMVYQCPVLAADKDGRLQWTGPAHLWGVVGMSAETGGGYAFARMKWIFNAADVVLSSVSFC